jgi:hypothetical protein
VSLLSQLSLTHSIPHSCEGWSDCEGEEVRLSLSTVLWCKSNGSKESEGSAKQRKEERTSTSLICATQQKLSTITTKRLSKLERSKLTIILPCFALAVARCNPHPMSCGGGSTHSPLTHSCDCDSFATNSLLSGRSHSLCKAQLGLL